MNRSKITTAMVLLSVAACDEAAPPPDGQEGLLVPDLSAVDLPEPAPEPIHQDPDGDVDHGPAGPADLQQTAQLPPPSMVSGCEPQWDAVALFFNVNLPPQDMPAGYATTTASEVSEWLDEGPNPFSPSLSEFTCNYWSALTYGELGFGVDTPRDTNGDPLLLTLADESLLDRRESLAAELFEQAPEAIWQAAGSFYRNDAGDPCTPGGSTTCYRYVPSVAVFANYSYGGSASINWNHVMEEGGHSYKIGEVYALRHDMTTFTPAGASAPTGRIIWNTMQHEWAHNFLDQGDFYGPSGCTGYWDVLGHNHKPSEMSDAWSRSKVVAGYLDYTEVLEGETPSTHYSLAPFATTGEAIKIVPDPVLRPHEYFLLEHRTSTGSEPWRPDGALTGSDGGLLITHVKDDLVLPPWLNREAPVYDPEFADFSDLGTTKWTGSTDLAGKTFPYGSADSFTASTSPSSRFYGGRESGLSITNIAVVGDHVEFDLEVDFGSDPIWPAWLPQPSNGLTVGHFTPESLTEGAEIFVNHANAAALLQYRQATLQLHHAHTSTIDGFDINASSRSIAGDFDGDGLDELFFRDDDNAAILEWNGSEFEVVDQVSGWLDGWNLGASDWETTVAFDFSGRDFIVLRSGGWMAVAELSNGELQLQWIDSGTLGSWDLEPTDKMLVGDFYYPGLEQVAMVGPDEVGLFFKTWTTNEVYHPFPVQTGFIGSWNIGSADRHVVGDFTGDGRDDIFVRSANWAGLWTWSGDEFETIFIQSGDLDGVDLSADDRIWAGHFSEDRDGILMQADGQLHIFEFDGTTFERKVSRGLGLGKAGTLAAADQVLVADFHPVGAEAFSSPGKDIVLDHIDDVYIHGSSRSAMVGRDRVPWKTFDKFRVMWSQNMLAFDGPFSISQ